MTHVFWRILKRGDDMCVMREKKFGWDCLINVLY